jgi:hypothetical protein
MPKRILSGTVVSSNSNKTIVVRLLDELSINYIKRLSVYLKIIMYMMKIMNSKVVILLI